MRTKAEVQVSFILYYGGGGVGGWGGGSPIQIGSRIAIGVLALVSLAMEISLENIQALTGKVHPSPPAFLAERHDFKSKLATS